MDASTSDPNSPTRALVVLPQHDTEELADLHTWQPILSLSHQVVLYNPTSHALTVRSTPSAPIRSAELCPYCRRPYNYTNPIIREGPLQFGSSSHPSSHSRARDYFHLLEIANETVSRPSTPGGHLSSDSNLSSRIQMTHSNSFSRRSSSGNVSTSESVFPAESMAEGYFKAFFREEYRLGMGANGSVFLCQHVLDGNPLGHFAVKKIAVGQSHSYLYKTLREVHLLESLRHPNIITYHHAWLETCQFSNFGPRVPTLFVLMQWAEGGSLDDFIELRLGRPLNKPHSFQPGSSPALDANLSPETDVSMDSNTRLRAERIRAFRAAQAQRRAEEQEGPSIVERRKEKKREGVSIQTAVHLLSGEESKSLFGDVVCGLAFLHDRSILHLDLKPGNVLLTWDEGALIPRAMLSDFGTSQDRIQPDRRRSGWTGTLEYTPPELLPSPLTGALKEVDSKADMWSLGMILHMMLFFRLPWRYSRGVDSWRGANGSKGKSAKGEDEELTMLEKEVLEYPGFKSSPLIRDTFELRGLPNAFLILLENLLNTTPKMRPSSDRIMKIIREGKLDPVTPRATREGALISIPHLRAQSSPPIAVAISSVDHDITTSDDLDEKRASASMSDSDGKMETEGTYATSSPGAVEMVLEDEDAIDLDDAEGEKTPLLALPSSGDARQSFASVMSRREPILWGWRIPLWVLNGLDIAIGPVRFRMPHRDLVRVLKTILLVIKITTLQSLCPPTHIINYSWPVQPITTTILLVAIMDVWTEHIATSVYLIVFHIMGLCIVKYGRMCVSI